MLLTCCVVQSRYAYWCTNMVKRIVDAYSRSAIACSTTRRPS